MNKEFYAGNRKSLYQKLEAGSLVVVFSGHAPIKTNDENYPFFTNRNFLYLTGIEQENIVLMAYVGEGTIEEAWNRKYQEYLGFTPKNHQEGILQDVHWASGCVGYFQGYALGDAYAAQFAHKLLADCPDAFEKLGKGDSSVIGNWLKEHIHQYGQTYSAREMLKKATGEELNTGYYIEYLKEKYLH